jgi:transposase, IS30 family
VQLIAQGVSNSEACRLVGINRKTGNRWRYGRRVRNSAGAVVIYAPVKITEARPRSPRYLSEQERIQIADLLAARMSVRRVAEQLGRAPSTISREIRRNSDPDGHYRPHHAEQAALRRAGKPRTRRLAGDAVLAEVVQRLLAKRWSPERRADRRRGQRPATQDARLAAPRRTLRRREPDRLTGPSEPRTRAGIASGSALGPRLRRTPRVSYPTAPKIVESNPADNRDRGAFVCWRCSRSAAPYRHPLGLGSPTHLLRRLLAFPVRGWGVRRGQPVGADLGGRILRRAATCRPPLT